MEMIPVTKSFFPPVEEYQAQLYRIWESEWLTNRGELVIELEDKVAKYLNLQEAKMITMCNGTIPLQIALKVLGNGGEIITTPFSYVATTAAIVWENCTPVFVDIHPKYLTIDVSKIESAITSKTTCILATHVFGNPCDVEAIDSIANKYNLKVIYDAAHCFGVEYKGKSIFEYGDISTCSFHATKLFHTGEGGALFTRDTELFHKCFYSHNFGHKDSLSFYGLGINGKISELQAAMGLAVLPHMKEIMNSRRQSVVHYNDLLDFTNIRSFNLLPGSIWNYSYYPIVFRDEDIVLKIQNKLNELHIYPRRYFAPSLNILGYLPLSLNCPVSEEVSTCILCLPLFYDLSPDNICLICDTINDELVR